MRWAEVVLKASKKGVGPTAQRHKAKDGVG